VQRECGDSEERSARLEREDLGQRVRVEAVGEEPRARDPAVGDLIDRKVVALDPRAAPFGAPTRAGRDMLGSRDEVDGLKLE
jgi:hypothetical protein